ncbi:MAG: peptide deformylase [Anaerolineales bacterium]
MAVREILIYPKFKMELRAKSEPIQAFNRQIRQMIEDLKDTLMAHQDGIGLAAPQIGVHLRTVVVRLGGRNDWDPEAGPPIALINPEIVEKGDERKDFDGCLSFPGLFGETIRPHYVRVTGLTEDGNTFNQIYQGFDAVLVHHEIDHLDGVLFIDLTESLDDLYRVYLDYNGKPVRIPMSDILQKMEEPVEFIR